MPQNAHIAHRAFATFCTTQRACHRGLREVPSAFFVYTEPHFRGNLEKLMFDNIGIACGILSLGGTEPEIHLGVIYPPNCNVRICKKFIAI